MKTTIASDVIEKKHYYIILFSFYQNLLTVKQQNIFKYYYEEDYSLAEIAKELSISRNAVWDSLQKITNALDEYEIKLHLWQNDQIREQYLKDLQKYCDEDGLKIIQKIIEME